MQRNNNSPREKKIEQKTDETKTLSFLRTLCLYIKIEPTVLIVYENVSCRVISSKIIF